MGEAMSGLLADLYSTIDSKKRQLAGLLADPVETLKLGLLNFKNDQNALLDTQSTAYPWTGAYQQKPTPQQQAAAQKQLADQGANMGMAAATVWHGSPHKFDKFDSSKIGTGEGAQAYGHGLYLAESPDVAGGYAERLSSVSHNDERVPRVLTYGKQNPRRIDMNAPSNSLSPAETALTYINLYGGRTFEASEALRDMAGAGLKDSDKYQKAFDVLTSGRLKTGKIGAEYGNMYKVDLPDEAIAKMLDWDKPLSQQHPDVQKALSDYSVITGKPIDPLATGEQIYRQFRGKNLPQADAGQIASSNELKWVGIPGIRYLDGGSRGAGSGTSNYVVFPGNEDLLTILERNGHGLLGQ